MPILIDNWGNEIKPGELENYKEKERNSGLPNSKGHFAAERVIRANRPGKRDLLFGPQIPRHLGYF
jgi:hypothetical protein